MSSKQSQQQALAVIRSYHIKATKVQDAEREIYLDVTQRFIHGASVTPDQCPLARTCKTEMELDGALISRGVCYTIRNGLAERYVPAGITRDMLRQFDKTGKFIPGIYRLSVPPPSQTLGARSKRKQPISRSKGNHPPKPRTYLVPGERIRLGHKAKAAVAQ